MEIKQIDEKAKLTAEHYKKCERSLLQIISQVDFKKVYLHYGYNSLFSYVTHRLGMTPAVTYNFIAVIRKSQEVPQLKEEVLNGKISISKARKVVSVINKSNHKKWLKLANEKTQKQLEKEVALACPNEALFERADYIPAFKEVKEKIRIKTSVARMQLELGVSEKLMLKLRRAQDLESQRMKTSISLEDTLNEVLDVYLSKKDPLKKAERQKIRGRLRIEHQNKQHSVSKNIKIDSSDLPQRFSEQLNSCKASKQFQSIKTSKQLESCKTSKQSLRKKTPNSIPKRKPIPAKIQHQVRLRDKVQCNYKDQFGNNCGSKRFLEIHHIIPVQKGGGNNLENLQLVCSGHHKALHIQHKNC